MTTRAAGVLTATYIAVMPLSWSPLPLNSKLCDPVLIALAAILLFRGVGRWRPNGLDLCVGLYLVGSIVAIRPAYGWALPATALLKQLSVVLVYVVFAWVARGGGAAHAARWMIGTAVVLCVAGIGALMIFAATGHVVRVLGTAMPLPYVGRIFRLYGAMDSPEMFACFLTFAVPLVVVPVISINTRTRVCALGAMALAAIGTIAHSIGGGLLATAVSVRPASPRRRALRPLLMTAAVLALIVINGALIVAVRHVTVTDGRSSALAQPDEPYAFQDTQGAQVATVQLTYNWMSYYLLKRVAFDAFLASPLRGAGLGRFHELTERAYQAGLVQETYRSIDPHSTPMGRLAETGAIGGATLAALWVAVLLATHRLELRPGTQALAFGLLGGFVGLAVNALNVDVMNFRFLWLGFGLVRGLSETHDSVAG